MKALLRKTRTPWIISIGSALFGLFIFALCFPQAGEGRAEGIGFTLGYLGFPSTIIAFILFAWIPHSWDPNGFIPPIVTTIFFLAQWQLIALWIHRWLQPPLLEK